MCCSQMTVDAAVRSCWVRVLLPCEIRTPTDGAFEIGSKNMFWWEVKNILSFVLFADYWYLQSGLEARRGRDSKWITLPLNKRGVGGDGGCLLQEITRQNKGSLFSLSSF